MTFKKKPKSSETAAPLGNQKKLAKQLSQTFLALTLFIFSTYFAISFFNKEKNAKKVNSNKVMMFSNKAQSEEPLSEIQEKIIEKINAQPDLVEMIGGIQVINFKTQIVNDKILEKLKLEFQNIFEKNDDGSYLMEVEVFNDNSTSSTDLQNNAPDKEYFDTESNLVAQVSLFEKKSNNKVGEFAVTIPMRMFIVKTDN